MTVTKPSRRAIRAAPDDFASHVPAHRFAKLRAALADAALQGALGEPLPADAHRAIARRWARGRAAVKAPPLPKGELGKEMARNIAKLRHAFATAGASAEQLAELDAAIAAIARLAGDVATAPGGRSWRPRTRGKRGRGRIRHPAAGVRAQIVDQAVAEALPGWRDGMALPPGAVPDVCRRATELCRPAGLARPSQSRIRAWLKRRSQTPA
jgi:hypothetical protein